MVAEVCVILKFIPGPFETPISIPLVVKELVPKYHYDYYYYGYYDDDRKRRESDGEEMVREARSGPGGKKPLIPAGELKKSSKLGVEH